MKINANENVLLMNKKVRTMEAAPTPTPETPVTNPENGMKALDAMGRQNVMFQGGMTKIAEKGAKQIGNKVAKGALIAAAAATLASCVEQYQAVNLGELSQAIAALQAEIATLRTDQASSNAKQVELLRQILSLMNQMYASQDAFYEDSENFYAEVLRTMVTEDTLKNYFGEDSPIYKAIMAVMEKLEAGVISAQDAYKQIIDLLTNIDNNVTDIKEQLTTFVKSFNEYTSQFGEDFGEIKDLIKDIKNNTDDIRDDAAEINDKLNDALPKILTSMDSIKVVIEKADANNVEAMTDCKDEIIAVLEKLGYEEQEILKMSKDEIIAAIEENTQAVKDNGAVLNQILSYVAILPELKDAGEITNKQLNDIYNKLDEINIDVEISPETLAELKALFDEYFEEIADKLDQINDNITKQGEAASEELKEINANVKVIKGDVQEIKDNSAIQIAYDQYILDAINNVDEGITNIEEIAAQIGVDVAWIREHGGGSGSTVDLSKIEQYLEEEIANTTAINAKLDLMLAAQDKDSEKMDEALEYLKSLDSTTKSILNTEENFKDMVIAEFAAFGIQMDENNEWLEKIYNKKCDCAKDVTIIVEKIYKYLVDGNEGIVDYDDLFDDLFGEEEESTKAVAMATSTKANDIQNTASKRDINRLMMADNNMRLANKINKMATGQPLKNGVYNMGNIIYSVSGDLDKTMSVADFYKIAAEQINQQA